MMSKSIGDDPRMSEETRLTFKNMEKRIAELTWSADERRKTIFRMKNEYQQTLEKKDEQLGRTDSRLATVLDRFGFRSYEGFEAAPEMKSVEDYLKLKEDRDKLEEAHMALHTACGEAMARAKAEREQAQALQLESDRLKEQAETWKSEVKRLEQVQDYLQQQLVDSNAGIPTTPQADKENRVFQINSTSVNSAPSTPTKSRTPGRALSLSPRKSPSKARAQKHLAAAHQALEIAHAQLREEKNHLSDRFEKLCSTHDAVIDRYKKDYTKWNALWDWLYDKASDKHNRVKADLTPKQRHVYETKRLGIKKSKILKELAKEGAHDADDRPQKGNTASDAPAMADIVRGHDREYDLMYVAGPATSPRRKRPLERAQSSRHGNMLRLKRARTDNTQASSDTEDDSQALPPLPSQELPVACPPSPGGFSTVATQPIPAKIADDVSASLQPQSSIPTPAPTASPETSAIKEEPTSPIILLTTRRKQQNTLFPTPVSLARPATRATRTKGYIKPEPVDEFVQGGSKTLFPMLKDTNTLSTSAARQTMGPPNSATPGNYSTYKGRGRYARSGPAETTINAEFEINPAHNGGAQYAFDDVVRNRAERLKLPAGDCMECRAYYEGVGALPDRLKRPLWRSPTTSPNVAGGRITRLCPAHAHSQSALPAPDFSQADADDVSREVERHRADVSRHRARWQAPESPPGYWDIGFPDTQEADGINDRAREMQQRKLDVVAREAERGGIFRKRKS